MNYRLRRELIKINNIGIPFSPRQEQWHIVFTFQEWERKEDYLFVPAMILTLFNPQLDRTRFINGGDRIPLVSTFNT